MHAALTNSTAKTPTPEPKPVHADAIAMHHASVLRLTSTTYVVVDVEAPRG